MSLQEKTLNFFKIGRGASDEINDRSNLNELDLFSPSLYPSHPLYSVELHASRIDAFADELMGNARRQGRRLAATLREQGRDSAEARRLLAKLPELRELGWQIKHLRKMARRLRAMAPFLLLGVELHDPMAQSVALHRAAKPSAMMIQ